jgi:hypothetical protein
MTGACASKLPIYDEMVRAIAAAYEDDEVKSVASDEEKLAHYKRMSLGIVPEQMACEIRLRAERRAIKLAKKLSADDVRRLSPEALAYYRKIMRGVRRA